jgi:hypothetical protein
MIKAIQMWEAQKMPISRTAIPPVSSNSILPLANVQIPDLSATLTVLFLQIRAASIKIRTAGHQKFNISTWFVLRRQSHGQQIYAYQTQQLRLYCSSNLFKRLSLLLHSPPEHSIHPLAAHPSFNRHPALPPYPSLNCSRSEPSLLFFERLSV